MGLLTSDRIPPGRNVYYGMIADGIHTHPAALRIAHRAHPAGIHTQISTQPQICTEYWTCNALLTYIWMKCIPLRLDFMNEVNVCVWTEFVFVCGRVGVGDWRRDSDGSPSGPTHTWTAADRHPGASRIRRRSALYSPCFHSMLQMNPNASTSAERKIVCILFGHIVGWLLV